LVRTTRGGWSGSPEGNGGAKRRRVIRHSEGFASREAGQEKRRTLVMGEKGGRGGKWAKRDPPRQGPKQKHTGG